MNRAKADEVVYVGGMDVSNTMATMPPYRSGGGRRQSSQLLQSAGTADSLEKWLLPSGVERKDSLTLPGDVWRSGPGESAVEPSPSPEGARP